MQTPVNRRATLANLGVVGLVLGTTGLSGLGKVLAGDRDRPLLSRNNERAITCDNVGVPVSSVADRKSTTTDFKMSDTCALTRDSVEGPYFICAGANIGKDISGNLRGQHLTIALRVVDPTCTPISGAIVDIWNCDAGGAYSGFDADPDEEYRGGPVDVSLPSRELRGTLATDNDGIAEFDTIYPGFYAGRAIHVHFKVHIGNQAYLTSQALFPENVNSQILAMAHYNASRGTKRLLNAEDPSFIGELDVLRVVERAEGLLSTLNLTVS